MGIIDAMVIGVIDYQDAVHSKIIYDFVDKRSDCLNHADYFPHTTHKKWRWTYDDGIRQAIGSDRLTDADVDFIINHLRREYGIRFTLEGKLDRNYYERQL